VHLASLGDLRSVKGQSFDKLKPNAATSKCARDVEFGGVLWERTEGVLGLRARGSAAPATDASFAPS
jgi:hypothetical protein